VNSDEINQHFNTDESMHIFRILQLLTRDILASTFVKRIRYAITQKASSVDFEFEFQTTQRLENSSPDIHNRLELLKGNINIQNSHTTTQITVNIPFNL